MQPVQAPEEKELIIQSTSPRANKILEKQNHILETFEALKQEQEQYGWSNKEFLDILHGVIKRHGNKSDEPQGILYT